MKELLTILAYNSNYIRSSFFFYIFPKHFYTIKLLKNLTICKFLFIIIIAWYPRLGLLLHYCVSWPNQTPWRDATASHFVVCRAWHITRGWKSLTRVGINEVLEKHNASTVMLRLEEVWNKIMNQRTETYYKAT